ncbi:MAG: hypothetical protein A2017_07340 [Lentisphaerae bacterium GWF2_44_16]|nr:MAG: hypothetical protein A2017_07340 [Lentisphaerae bacterium GWF2_44_16]
MRRLTVKSAMTAFFGFIISVSSVYADFDDMYEAITENDLQKNAIKDINKLLEEGSTVKDANKDGLTPLHVAAWYSKNDVIEYLISKGADVNAADVKGETPLHCAAWKNKPMLCAFLISKGAKPETANFYGQTYADILKELENDTSTPYGSMFKINSKENNSNNKSLMLVLSERAKRIHQEKRITPVTGKNISVGEYANATRNKTLKFDSDPETGKPRVTISVPKDGNIQDESIGTYTLEGKYVYIHVKGENDMKLQIIDLNNLLDTRYDFYYTLKDQVSAIKEDDDEFLDEPVQTQQSTEVRKTAPQAGK